METLNSLNRVESYVENLEINLKQFTFMSIELSIPFKFSS